MEQVARSTVRSLFNVFREAQLRVLAALVLLAMTFRAPRLIWGDTWFNLVLGREIAGSGLVHQNTLTAEGFGRKVVDAQWLAHLLLYALDTLVGLPGLTLLGAALTVTSFLAAAAFARSYGSASAGRTLLVGSIAYAVVLVQSVIRAQTLALPFIVLFACVLARDVRNPSRKVWWLVPATALWANLHGSVLMGPALVTLLGLGRGLDALRARRKLSYRQFVRDTLLAAGTWAAVFASPYARGLPRYYAGTVGNADYRKYALEWQPPSLSNVPEALLLIALVLLLLAFGWRRLASFELLACLAFALFALNSARQATPLALLTTALLPPAADAALGRHARFESDRALEALSRVLTPLAAVLFVVGVPWLVAHTLALRFPIAFTDRVAQASKPHSRLLVDEAHGDRLLWFHPELRGLVSHGSSGETWSATYLPTLAEVYANPLTPESQRWLSSYDLVVVDRASHPVLARALALDARWRAVAADPLATAFTHSPR